MAKQTAVLALSLIFGVLVLALEWHDFLKIIAGLLILGSLAWWGARSIDWRSTNFVVTSDRLIYRHGVFTKKGIEIPLDRVNNVMFSQTILERALGAGDLVIESAGESGRQAFSDVRKPTAVQNEIYRQIEANENRKFDRIGGNATAAQGGGSSTADELTKLDDLRARGVLSPEEFAAEKARLLGS